MGSHSGSTGLRVVLSGKATVHCVHDRIKRQVVTEEQVAAFGLEYGIIFNSKLHHVHRCSCCDNLFVATTVEPRYCDDCLKPLVHALGGALPEPEGVVA